MRTILFILTILLINSCDQTPKRIQSPPVEQWSLARVEQMSGFPQPYRMLDWKEKARQFDRLVFDAGQTGEYWPLIWKDGSRKNFDQETFGLYTAMGDVRQGPDRNGGMFHESLATIGAVLGASLVGIDKSDQQGLNYVSMLRNYFNADTKWNIVMNNTCPEVALLGGGYGRDWWYDVFPNMLYYAVCSFYPDEETAEPILRSVAEKFYQADSVLNGDYDHTFFNYAELTPQENWICHQQDAAAGHAYVLYAAYKRFGDPRYLSGAMSALEALLSQPKNTFYEILMPFGAYVAARLNAEEGTAYDFRPILEWTFNGDPWCREGWGVLADNWNGYEVSGLVGSATDRGGYAFLMNTFDAAWALVPMVRYDPAWAQVVAKWMLHAANAARLFYPDEIPDDHQTIPELKHVTKGVIGYEGLIKSSGYEEYQHLQAPVAQGDGPNWVPGENPPASQFSVYGSAHAGIFGSIIDTTNVKGILQLDLLACDFYRGPAYPSFLYYNPFDEFTTVETEVGEQKVDLYEAISHTFLKKNVSGKTVFPIDAKQPLVIVVVPSGGEISYHGEQVAVNNIVIDYQNKVK